MAKAPERFELTVDNAARDDEEGETRVCLELIFPGGKICMKPEDPADIRAVETDAETGAFNTSPQWGAYYVRWSSEEIEMCAGKYGPGNGGVINVVLRSTPALLSSLRAALKAWKDEFS